MIKIEQKTIPVVWQIDTSYTLPDITGQVRWNGRMKCFEVDTSRPYDIPNTNNWQRIDNTIQLQSNPEWEEIYKWAKEKMSEERRIKELADKYPAVKDLQEKLKLVLKLVDNEAQ